MVCVNQYRESAGGRLTKNASDVARIALTSSAVNQGADINIVAAGGLANSSITAQCDIVAAARVAPQCLKTDSRVVVAIYIIPKRSRADSSVVAAGVAKKRTRTNGRVEATRKRAADIAKSAPAPTAVFS